MATRKSNAQEPPVQPDAGSTGKKSKRPKSAKAAGTQKPSPSGSNDLIVVGIGASAGGLEALKFVLPGLPVDANMAFVIVQHLDPKHRSMMASLLDRHTEMDVLEIVDGQLLESNKIYITPPGCDVKITGKTLHLSEPASSIGPRPSIDYFLTSLAESRTDRAVGIILSGTGSDGAHGIRAIKAGGGITIVQSESTARYNGMPHAAIETGHVDLIVDPDKIGKELEVAVKYPKLVPKVPPEADAPKDIDLILQMIAKRTGANLIEYKLSTINRRVGRRMALHKIVSLADYLNYVKNVPTELDLLLKDILISVTAFFRDPEAFQALKRMLVQFLKTKSSGETIRIWVPGCATGEEAYSIAILLHQQLGDTANRYNIQIFGTDLDQDAIVRARKGVYPTSTVVDVDPQILNKYFSAADNTVQVIKSIREMIVFAKQDLTQDPPFSHLDMISCRNLLIYFNSSLQKKIVPMFHYILNPGGLLFLGKSESIGQFADLFVPAAKKWKIFQRRDTLRLPLADFGLGMRSRFSARTPLKLSPKGKEVPVKQIFAESVVNILGNSAVMIDDRQEIIYVQGDVGPYLTLAQGEIGLNILNMVIPALRLDMRALIHKATRENQVVRSNKIRFQHKDQTHQIILHAGPAAMHTAAASLTLIIFEEIAPIAEKEQDTVSDVSADDPRILELEQELAAAREHLQTTVEELETSNEELQSLNEELQSANEELQSSNEELETSNEELQSTNEELTTVNEELQVKSNELAEVNTDLENILKRSGTTLIIVNKALKITRFTPPVTRFFQLTASDCGQVITTIPSNVSLPDLRRIIASVIDNGRDYDHEIDVDAERFLLRIRPYLDEFGQPAGAILTFTDTTGFKRQEMTLRHSNAYLSAILANVFDGIIVVDEKGVIESLNPAAERIFEYSSNEIVGKNVSTLQPEPHRSQHDAYIGKYLETGKAGMIGKGGEVKGQRKNGQIFPMELIVTEMQVDEARKFVGIVRDLSGMKQMSVI